jgi:fructokinase
MMLGIDLGGTKIEVIALDERGGELLRERCNTPQGNYGATVAAVATLVRNAEERVGAGDMKSSAGVTLATVGIGIPGTESKATGLIKNANSTCLIGRPLRRDIEVALGRPVRLANDANCFALSEATDGAGAGAEVVFGVILGTGVGGGIVVRGHVLAGINGIAGEWGHNPMPGEHHRPSCYCGRKGCIELYLSGPGMAKEHKRTTLSELAPPAIVARAAAGDTECEATLKLYEARLARALATVINIVDPDVIVLGGGLSNLDRLYANVPALWDEHVFSDRVDTRLVKAKFGDSSGARGAAWLWND